MPLATYPMNGLEKRAKCGVGLNGGVGYARGRNDCMCEHRLSQLMSLFQACILSYIHLVLSDGMGSAFVTHKKVCKIVYT